MAAKKTIELTFADDDKSVSFGATSTEADDNVKVLNFGGFIVEVKGKKKATAKPSTIHLNFNDENKPTDNNIVVAKKKIQETPEVKQDEEQLLTSHESDDFVVISKQKVTTDPQVIAPSIPFKPLHMRSNPVKPKQERSPPKAEHNGGSSWRSNLAEPKQSPPKVAKAIDKQNVLESWRSEPKQETVPPKIDQVAVTGAAGLWAQEDNVDFPQEQKVEVPQVTEEDWKIFKQFMQPDRAPEVPCYDELVTLNKVKLIKNHEEFVCPVCQLFIKKGKGVVLKNCLHNFCRICLVDEIEHNYDNMGQVKCPMTVERCEHIIDDEEVKDLLGDSYPAFLLKIYQMLSDMVIAKEREEEAEKYAALPAMLNADNVDCIENSEAFECKICFCDIAVNDGIILKNCLHKFCKECLIEQIKHSEEFTVKCPNDDDEDGSCTFTIQEREIRKLAPADLFEKHLELSLKLYQGASETAFQCRTPNCRGFVEVDENVRGFTCEVCDKVNCVGCKAIHQGMNCQEYEFEKNPDGVHQRANAESETAIRNLIAAGNAMFCPRCGIPVVKDEGCDFITCTTCKLGICWRTKKPRQPITKINGEVIDGCHCRENGIPCHPQCGNCH